jgi:glucose/arabinose dehydrogenase
MRHCLGLAVLALFVLADAARLAAVGEIAVPAGFRVDTFATNLGGARGLAVDPAGVLIVTAPAKGRVLALPDRIGDGRASNVVTLAEDLDLPHGVAFRGTDLYVAETSRIVRFRYDARTISAARPTVVVAGLPRAGHHWSRSIAFGPDGRLYVAIGSSCDACAETDARRAAIVRYNADGSGQQRFASGLRNPVGLAFAPESGALWTAVNERDWTGGGAPPDYVTEVHSGAAYGWPTCFARGGAFAADPRVPAGTPCRGLTVPSVELPPHSAPLGLTFYTGSQFPAAYRGSLFVALHGSRAGLAPAGYAIARVVFRPGAAPVVEPFATGWRAGDEVLGRPVDLAVGRDGSLYVSDDHGDRVLRISYAPR